MTDSGIQHFRFESNAPLIKGHYSHVSVTDSGVFYISGQKSWHPKTGEIRGISVSEQTAFIFENINTILDLCGLNLSNVTRIQCHLSDVSGYEEFNDAYSVALGENKPTRTVLAGYTLRDGALVELVVDGFSRNLNQGE